MQMHFGYCQMKYSSLTVVRDREYRNRHQYKKEFTAGLSKKSLRY